MSLVAVSDQELMQVDGGRSLWERRRNRGPVDPARRARIERGAQIAGNLAREAVKVSGVVVAVGGAIVKAPVVATVAAGVAVASLFFD